MKADEETWLTPVCFVSGKIAKFMKNLHQNWIFLAQAIPQKVHIIVFGLNVSVTRSFVVLDA